MDRHDIHNAHGMGMEPSPGRAARAFQRAAARAKASYSIDIYQCRHPRAAKPSAPRPGRRLSWKLCLLLVVLAVNWVLV